MTSAPSSCSPRYSTSATVPVVAAGGIATGSQIAGPLVTGADGVWIGTRFIATAEAGCQDVYKEAVVEAGPNSTLRTPHFDGLHVRQLRNRFTDVWDGHENEMQPYPVQRMLTIPIRDAAAKASVKSHMNLAAGQAVGLICPAPATSSDASPRTPSPHCSAASFWHHAQRDCITRSAACGQDVKDLGGFLRFAEDNPSARLQEHRPHPSLARGDRKRGLHALTGEGRLLPDDRRFRDAEALGSAAVDFEATSSGRPTRPNGTAARSCGSTSSSETR